MNVINTCSPDKKGAITYCENHRRDYNACLIIRITINRDKIRRELVSARASVWHEAAEQVKQCSQKYRAEWKVIEAKALYVEYKHLLAKARAEKSK